MNLNLRATAENTYDAIVVGSGISGGWAAKELTEKGLKTLVLERGRNIEHVKDYPTMNMNPWDFPSGDRVSPEEAKDYQKQMRTGYTIRESTKHWWVKDTEHPYSEVKQFDWIRGYHVGGRSLLWGRQSYRLSEMDFAANKQEGVAVDWPIRYKDMEKWYDYVEEFAGISGQKEGLAQLPDGKFLPPMELNCVEKHVRDRVAEKFNDRILTIGRNANLTVPHKGRGKCQFRNLCMRGCPYGGYFSSNASTLPAANATGNLTIRPFSIVSEVLYDKDTKKATGVRIKDSQTKETIDFNAKIVFVNASCIGTTQILMQSANDVWEGGLGSSSGELGHNLMDHHFRLGARGRYDGFNDRYYKGRRANGIYIPRFRNLPGQPSTKKDFIRGYGYQGGASRTDWTRFIKEMTVGKPIKELVQEPGPWVMGMTAFGECLPYHENKMTLNRDLLDIDGMPTVTFDAEWKENEYKMREDMMTSAAEILESAGFKDVNTYNNLSYPGTGIHEMGTARMGRDPKTSVLNKWNQVWDAKNVFVTDGAAMTSAGCQNPSLTYMALTARAANHAIEELNKQNI